MAQKNKLAALAAKSATIQSAYKGDNIIRKGVIIDIPRIPSGS